MRRAPFLILLVPIALFADTGSRLDPTVAKPPVAPTRPHSISLHGMSWNDPYFWIKDKNDPATIKYIEEENAYGAAVAKPLEPLREKVYSEILGRIKQTDLSVPFMHRGWWNYSKQIEGKQYSVRCRKKGSLDADEEV